MAAITQANEIRETVRRLEILNAKTPKRADVVNIKCSTQVSLRDSAHTALVAVTTAGVALLPSPVRSVIGRVSTLPCWIGVRSPVCGLPGRKTGAVAEGHLVLGPRPGWTGDCFSTMIAGTGFGSLFLGRGTTDVCSSHTLTRAVVIGPTPVAISPIRRRSIELFPTLSTMQRAALPRVAAFDWRSNPCGNLSSILSGVRASVLATPWHVWIIACIGYLSRMRSEGYEAEESVQHDLFSLAGVAVSP